MAVQAHHPCNSSFPDLASWLRSCPNDNNNCIKNTRNDNMKTEPHHRNATEEDLNGSLWAHQVPKIPNTSYLRQTIDGCITETHCNTNTVAKRSWESIYEEPLLLNSSICAANTVLPQRVTAPVHTGLQLATSPAVNHSCHNSPQPSTSECCPSMTPDYSRYIRAHMDKQRNEIHQLVDLQVNALKQSLADQSQMHLRNLLSVLEDGVSKRLKTKDDEIEKVNRKSLKLEEMVKQLSLEIQLWKNLAKNNELMAVNLKQNLEQVMTQIRDQRHLHAHQNVNYMSREEGCGESEVDDTQSCQLGTQQRGVGSFENKELMVDQRKCRFCRVKEVCVLVLPCRHLCLCVDCEGRIDRCPLCGITKNASLQVYV